MENDEFILPGETNKEIGLATLKTIESLKGVRSILLRFQLRFFFRRLKVLLKHWTSGEKRK